MEPNYDQISKNSIALFLLQIMLFFFRCCNTCEDVKEAYRQRKWAFPDPQNITQCQNEHYADKLKNAFAEGCQIYGTLLVNRVSSCNFFWKSLEEVLTASFFF